MGEGGGLDYAEHRGVRATVDGFSTLGHGCCENDWGFTMQTFVMLGKYSTKALQGMSIQRTQTAKNMVRQFGGEVETIYAMLGEHDLLIIVSMPGLEDAIKVSIALTKLTGIAFTTLPAVPVATFDRLTSEL